MHVLYIHRIHALIASHACAAYTQDSCAHCLSCMCCMYTGFMHSLPFMHVLHVHRIHALIASHACAAYTQDSCAHCLSCMCCIYTGFMCSLPLMHMLHIHRIHALIAFHACVACTQDSCAHSLLFLQNFPLLSIAAYLKKWCTFYNMFLIHFFIMNRVHIKPYITCRPSHYSDGLATTLKCLASNPGLCYFRSMVFLWIRAIPLLLTTLECTQYMSFCMKPGRGCGISELHQQRSTHICVLLDSEEGSFTETLWFVSQPHTPSAVHMVVSWL
jgi:hypothetical protein